jgi:hypothetical protein
MSSRSIQENVTGIAPELCREELKRVLDSKCFAKSPRLSEMLDVICRHTLDGRLDDLTEQQIGIHVFQRPPGYNSSEDTIVRGTARHLRQRLESYYNEEGQFDSVRISVPKGGYVARFDPAPLALGLDACEGGPGSMFGVPLQVPSTPKEKKTPTRWPRSALTAVTLLACVSFALAAFIVSRPKPDRFVSTGPQALWEVLFTPGRKTLIVPGDASLDAYIAWEQHDVDLQNYTNQNYQQNVTVSRPPSEKDVPLGVRSVTPMADLRLVSELVRAQGRMGMPQAEGWTEIRYARDVVVADTHDNNLILIGSETFNPWVTLYQPLLDFDVHWDYKGDVYSVDNRAQKSGEEAQYQYSREGPHSHPLTLIALVDNTQGQGRVLLVEGTSMGTTYAAIAFLTNEHLWRPVISAATDSNGRLHGFEALLSSDFVRGGVSNTSVIAFHKH